MSKKFIRGTGVNKFAFVVFCNNSELNVATMAEEFW